MRQQTIGKHLELVANWSGFAFSLWLIYHGIVTRSLWVVVGLFVASAGAFNLGMYDKLDDYLARRRSKGVQCSDNESP